MSIYKAGLLLLVVAAPFLLRAERIVSSLTNSGLEHISSGSPFWLASPFRTDGTYRKLSSITLNLQGGSALAAVRLFSDNGGQPGGTIADLGTRTITGASDFWTFTPGSLVLLNPSTQYWVGVGNVSSTNFLVLSYITNNFSYSAVTGASMINQGADGFGSNTNPPPQFDLLGTNFALPFEVDGDAVTLAILRLVPQAGGGRKIISTNGMGYPHVVQATTNLGPTAVWETLGSNALGPSGAWEFTDVNAAGFQKRFYRSFAP